MYQNFIGIDIGKDSFHVAVYPMKLTNEYPNNDKGFAQLNEDHKDFLSTGLVILETTGGYEMPLIRYLQAKQYCVHRANTRRVKSFIRSLGQLGKSDPIDAKGLARYGHERHSELSLFVEREEHDLLKLVNRRTELKHMLVQEKNRLQAPEQERLRASYEQLIKALQAEISSIEAQINEVYANNIDLQERKEVLKTIPGIGDVTAMALISLMPELGRINRRQIASLAGLAPHPNESGKKIGYRYTRGGRQNIKPVLFMSAMTAARSHSNLGKAYEKHLSAGKKKMVALTALMRKIIVISNAKMRDHYAAKAIALAA